MAKKYKEVISDKKLQAERLMNKNQLTKCSIAIHAASATSATAGAVPIPVADAIPITASQVAMVVALGQVFDAHVTESVAKGLIGAAASTFVGRSLVKMIPIIGWGISAAVAAGVTEAIGWTIAVDFAKDAKNKWEKEHTTTSNVPPENNAPGAEGSNTADEDNATEDAAAFKENLKKRAEPFLSGEKKPSEFKKEFDALISDIEKILGDLPDNDPLRKIYDELSLILD